MFHKTITKAKNNKKRTITTRAQFLQVGMKVFNYTSTEIGDDSLVHRYIDEAPTAVSHSTLGPTPTNVAFTKPHLGLTKMST